ncbi:MAG TPA: hypothetical protein VFQ53_20175 [Kofleriaceae bacterium]|nr:hypothetical protein [Kofleriaceae bacterium]
MRSTPLFLATAIVALATTRAHADQCALVPPPVAQRAAALVKKDAYVLDFCEPCHDKTPGKPYRVQTVEVWGGQLRINGTEVDLAYLYVETSPGVYKNVGLGAQCGAADVSETIVNGKPSGPIARTPVRPGPPPPPPPTAITGVNDFEGTWRVRLHTRVSSCTATPPDEQARWITKLEAGTLSLESGTGARLTGAIESQHRMNRSTLRPETRSSATAIQLMQLSKDYFSGTMVRAERGPSPKDPVCVVQQDISGRRE